MPCVYENIYPISQDKSSSLINEKYYEHIILSENNSFIGTPHIAFTLVRDSSNYHYDAERQEINSDDFKGCISIGSSSTLYSEDNLGFENRPVRLTVVKVNQQPAGKIIIGDNVMLQGTAIICYNAVEIGNNVLFGPKVTIMDSSGHPIRCRGNHNEAARTTSAKVTIKDNAWIGMGATILKGVTIGENSVVSANSVVFGSIPDNCIAIGNPATVVKHL
ncbi:acyltransferase [Photobacterium sp. OFAV2-7]|uniref:acyltransferase n=1 Tax=Photobacterium sp. OFAV2-7 TaxID=2917748 RepID=UPI001EF52CC7|nr:acyltransferase [Photobacterium sp. OFAV2-7]MCG7586282.1 acyltransferase [Photobacterium sp. OFAV2-7]